MQHPGVVSRGSTISVKRQLPSQSTRVAHVKAIQELTGHRTAQVTLDLYGHLMPGLHESLTEV
jgi:integrase